ncbi:hypothetical protein BDZ97DRAFT_1846304 [Flammula alnicola]|nr:hypothetical protein BDZ97DRAFT_1846304 [Flammula alnicola]
MIYLRTTATTDNRPPARQIIRRLERYPNAALWGFPIDRKRMLANFDSTVPPNVDDEEELTRLLSDYTMRVLSTLQWKCNQVWYSGIISPKQVYAKGERTGEKTIIAIIKSTRREDKFAPPSDKVEELKKVFAEQGFTEEPGWFIATD